MNTYRKNSWLIKKKGKRCFGVSSAKQVPVSNHYDELLELVLRSGEYAIRELTVDGLVEIIKAQGLQYRHIFVKVKFSTNFF